MRAVWVLEWSLDKRHWQTNSVGLDRAGMDGMRDRFRGMGFVRVVKYVPAKQRATRAVAK